MDEVSELSDDFRCRRLGAVDRMMPLGGRPRAPVTPPPATVPPTPPATPPDPELTKSGQMVELGLEASESVRHTAVCLASWYILILCRCCVRIWASNAVASVAAAAAAVASTIGAAVASAVCANFVRSATAAVVVVAGVWPSAVALVSPTPADVFAAAADVVARCVAIVGSVPLPSVVAAAAVVVVIGVAVAAVVVVFGSAMSRLLCSIVAKRFQLPLSFSSLSLFKFAEYLELVVIFLFFFCFGFVLLCFTFKYTLFTHTNTIWYRILFVFFCYFCCLCFKRALPVYIFECFNVLFFFISTLQIEYQKQINFKAICMPLAYKVMFEFVKRIE